MEMSAGEGPYSIVDLATWERSDAYSFFSAYEWPFFQVTAAVSVEALRSKCREYKQSFFLHYFHAALECLNEVPNFRMRLEGDSILDFHTVHGGCTVARENGTFGFGFFPYHENRQEFICRSTDILNEVKYSSGVIGLEVRRDLCFFSVLPWVSFTSFSNPHRTIQGDSIPRVVFGACRPGLNNSLELPVSVEVHHALADGLHVGLFFQKLQERLIPRPDDFPA
jgi:chloramphenicol O-acetyltransferase type A